MRRIINQTTTRVYKDGRLYDKTDTDTIEVPDPTPTPAPMRTLTTTAQTCAHCHEARTVCRCHTPQSHALREEDFMPLSILSKRQPDSVMQTPSEDWMPLSILSKRQP